MLGGTIVNISGPCFSPFERVTCKFDTESVEGFVVDQNRAICVQPFLFAQGYIRFEVAIGTEPFKWKGRYFVGKLSNVLSHAKSLFLFSACLLFEQKHRLRLRIEFSSEAILYMKGIQLKFKSSGTNKI